MRSHKILVELRRYRDWDGACLSCERAASEPHDDDCVTENAAVLIEQQHVEIERLRRELNKATIRGNGHARRAIDTSDEVMRLRAQIAELLPFARRSTGRQHRTAP